MVLVMDWQYFGVIIRRNCLEDLLKSFALSPSLVMIVRVVVVMVILLVFFSDG